MEGQIESRKVEIIDPTKAVKMELTPGVLKDQDRITAHFEMHHEHCCISPVSIGVKYSHFLETMEQPYMRRFKVTPQSSTKELNLAWLEGNCGSLILLNPPPDIVRRNKLTDEEKLEIENMTLHVSVGGSRPWLVRPGRFFVGEPSDVTQVRLWVPAGEREITMHVMPR